MSTAQLRVFVEYGMFLLIDFEARIPEEHPVGKNGLAGASDGATVIYTGLRSGDVHVEVVTSQSERSLDGSNWEDIVEISANFPRGHAQLMTALLNSVPDAPIISAAGPGWYRLRVHAHGRRHHPAINDEITENYLIQAWPSEARPDIVYKATDPVGKLKRQVITEEP